MLGEHGAALFVFVGAATVAVGALAVGARGLVSLGAAALVAAVAATTLAALALLRALPALAGRGGVTIVDAALVGFAVALGGSIGRRVQHAGHLLPACVVAACADVVSVVSPQGPTRAIAENARALSVLAFAFPVPGTHAAAPSLGAGDLVFVALLFGAAVAHDLAYRRMLPLAWGGVLAAGALSAFFGVAIPALPTIAAAVLLGVPAARRLPPKDRTVATIAMGAALVVVAAVVTRAWFSTG